MAFVDHPQTALVQTTDFVDDIKHAFDAFPYVLLALLIVTLLGIFLLIRYFTSPWRKVPPGPIGLPIIGNLLQLKSQKYTWLLFTEWKKKYGDIIYVNAAGQPMVILNTQKVAADLLARRAVIYSDRARAIVTALLTGGYAFGFTHFNVSWSRMRGAADDILQSETKAAKYHTRHTAEATILTLQVINQPKAWSDYFYRTTSSNIQGVCYDKKPVLGDYRNDPDVAEIRACGERLGVAARPGAYLVELFPWMLYIPSIFAPWKRNAIDAYKRDSSLFAGLFKGVEQQINAGRPKHGVVAQLVEGKETYGLTPEENAWVPGTLCLAGSDITTDTLSWWLLYLLLYPDTQKRAQKELDDVVGRSRSPTFDDFDRLPYIAAMVKEALRLAPVGPLGVPHASIQDDWYNGYFIPKGTTMVPNIWAENRDPAIYGPTADDFDPSRFLENPKIAPESKGEGQVNFGFGWRICPGRYVAKNMLFINIAKLLWAVTFERPRDAEGKLVPLDLGTFIDRGLATEPAPFFPIVTPRFPEAALILQREKELLGL